MQRAANGYDIQVNEGGPMGFGWGSSRALPAARWRQVLNPIPIMLSGGGDPATVVPAVYGSRMKAPTVGNDTHPWWVSAQTPVDIASGATKGGMGTTTPDQTTLMSFFSDLFGKAFGSTSGSPNPADNAPVVIYGAGSSGDGPSMGPIAIILILAVVGYFAYKRFRK